MCQKQPCMSLRQAKLVNCQLGDLILLDSGNTPNCAILFFHELLALAQLFVRLSGLVEPA